MQLPLTGRLLGVTLSHAIFMQFGDIMSACLNLMNDPIRQFFYDSMTRNYGNVTDEQFQTYFSASASTMFLGLMIGFFAMGKLMDGIGRKQTIILRCFLGILGSIFQLSAHLLDRFELFVIGHTLSGVVTAFKVVLYIWLAECSPDDKRGITALVVNSGAVVMVLLVTPLCLPTVIGTEKLWFLLPCLTAALATVHLILVLFFPQSPKQLYIQNRDEPAARSALRFYYGGGKELEIDNAIREMKQEKKLASKEKSSVLDVLEHDTHRFSFFLVFVCSMVPVGSALNIKSQYLVNMLNSYGLKQSQATTAMMAISVISLPACFISPLLVEKYGRRPLFLTITWLCAAEWALFSISEGLLNLGVESPLRWLFACTGSVLGQAALNLGMLVMAPIMIAELCPHNIRATVSEFTQVPPIAIAMIEVFIFPTLRQQFGAGLFVFLGLCCASLAVILQLQLMETAGLAVDEIINRLCAIHNKNHTMGMGWIHYGSVWDADEAKSTVSRSSISRTPSVHSKISKMTKSHSTNANMAVDARIATTLKSSKTQPNFSERLF